MGVVLVAGLRWGSAWVKTHLTPEKLEHVTDLANMAVRAAQRAVPTDVEKPGDWKYALASEALRDGAGRLGLKLTDAEVSSFIHAALGEMEQAKAVVASEAAA